MVADGVPGLGGVVRVRVGGVECGGGPGRPRARRIKDSPGARRSFLPQEFPAGGSGVGGVGAGGGGSRGRGFEGAYVGVDVGA